ncbi:hypothetical protein SDC9_53051 [bioreactor metagenome]|uniref:FecR protein domain-containing protein n=1 Tax=bioreactor metagenome TaxID=1076179 RepID=A0A644WTG7_9ZZZZ|nr:FecR domain-containing protein [Rikenellaceae bacterium]
MIDFKKIDNLVKYCIVKIFRIKDPVYIDDGIESAEKIIEKYSEENEVDSLLKKFNSINSDNAFNHFLYVIRKRRARRRFYYSINIAAILIVALFLFSPEKSTTTIVNKKALTKVDDVLLITENGESYTTSGDIKVSNYEIKASQKRPVELESSRIELQKTPEQLNTLVTPRGIRQQLTLSDGTVIWINSQSRLSFPTEFNDSARVVSLTGEAYFDVTESRKPFIVKLQTGEVTVYGTSFNVNSYDNSPISAVWLYTGSVKVSTTEEETMLKPGYNVRIDNATSLMSSQIANRNESPDWIRGMIEFYEEPLSGAFDVLQRWYGITYELSDDVKDLEVTMIISDKTSIEDLLELLELTQKVDVKRKNDTVIITKNLN